MTEWQTKKLGDLAVVLRGSTITRKEVTPGEVPVIAGGQTPSCYHNVSNRDGKTITVSASGAYAGFVQYFEIPIFASDCSTIKVKDENQTSSKFLFYMLQASQTEIYAFQRGSGQPHVYPSQLVGLDIPTPQIDEQHKIVEVLEDHLSRLDAALADVEEASKNAQRLERAVLFNLLENGKKEIGSSWMTAKIKDVLQQDKSGSMLGQGWSPQCDSEAALDELQWGSLKTTAVQYGEFDWRFNKLLPPHLEPRPHLAIEVGDFLITRLGPRNRCGVICRVKSCKQRILLPDKMFRFRPKLEILDPQFFEFFLISPQSIEILNTLKTGGSESGMNITQDRFLNFDVYFPTLKEQARLVKNVEESISLAKHARVSLSKFSSSSTALRYSLLQAAFTGQLTKEAVSV
jgi:type I restriction enzyme S subunit